MTEIPSWWEFALLTGGAFRLWRLLAADTILDRPRDWLTRRDSFEVHRERLDIWLHCPWCFGFWISLGLWFSWQVWPTATLTACTPLAISAVVALTAKHLDA